MPDLPLSACLEKGGEKAMGKVGKDVFTFLPLLLAAAPTKSEKLLAPTKSKTLLPQKAKSCSHEKGKTAPTKSENLLQRKAKRR